MAVTIKRAELSVALRLGHSDAEMAQVARLLAYGAAAVEKHAPEAPDAIQNEAVIRLRPTCSINHLLGVVLCMRMR